MKPIILILISVFLLVCSSGVLLLTTQKKQTLGPGPSSPGPSSPGPSSPGPSAPGPSSPGPTNAVNNTSTLTQIQPSDCEGSYIDPVCPTECGQPVTSVSKQWNTTQNPVGTGKACPSPTTELCPATEACPSDCDGWYSDPVCPTQCGQPATSVSIAWNTFKDPIGIGKACPSPTTASCPATAACPPVDCEGHWLISDKKFCLHTGGGNYLPHAVVKFVKTRDPLGTGKACPSGNMAFDLAAGYDCNECLNKNDAAPSNWQTSVTQFTRTYNSTFPQITYPVGVLKNEPCSIWPNQLTSHAYWLDW